MKQRGFTMVEVTLALALVTFCLLALIGLIPAGLESLRSSSTHTSAITCMQQISGAIRSSIQAAPDQFQAGGAYRDLSWRTGGPAVSLTWQNLSASGFPSLDASETRFAAHVEVTPPAAATDSGQAMVSVAWPAEATWDGTRWQNAQGVESMWVAFISLN